MALAISSEAGLSRRIEGDTRVERIVRACNALGLAGCVNNEGLIRLVCAISSAAQKDASPDYLEREVSNRLGYTSEGRIEEPVDAVDVVAACGATGVTTACHWLGVNMVLLARPNSDVKGALKVREWVGQLIGITEMTLGGSRYDGYHSRVLQRVIDAASRSGGDMGL